MKIDIKYLVLYVIMLSFLACNDERPINNQKNIDSLKIHRKNIKQDTLINNHKRNNINTIYNPIYEKAGIQVFDDKFIIDTSKSDIKKFVIVKVDCKKNNISISGLNEKNLTGYSLIQYLEKTDGIVSISGSFRDNVGLPIGLVILDKQLKNSMDKKTTRFNGIIDITDNKLSIINSKDYTYSKETDYAIQTGTVLISNDRIVLDKEDSFKKEEKPRSFLGIQSDGKILLGVINGNINLKDLANILNTDKTFKCKDAINLEGGGNFGMVYKINDTIKYVGNKYDHRPNAIVVTKK